MFGLMLPHHRAETPTRQAALTRTILGPKGSIASDPGSLGIGTSAPPCILPRAFAERCEGDRHHFRFIVSPDDALEMTDLRSFTTELAAQMEKDLGTRLDWVAVDHWNTEHPHVHLIVRGVRDGNR